MLPSPSRLLVAAALAALALGADALSAAPVFSPPRSALRVKVDSFLTDAFPVVEAAVTLDAPVKLDFRYLSSDQVGVIEEEVPVRKFRVEPFHPPLALGLVLDDSGSLEHDLRYLKEAADRFIGELDERDQTALITFHRQVELLQPLTSSKPALRRALGTVKAYGATALYDGVVAGIECVARADGKPTLLVVSDGTDQVYPGGRALSRMTVGSAVDLARKSGVEIYVIGVGRRVDKTVLEELAAKTGGFFWHAPDPRYLKPLFDAVTRSFQSRIKLIYESPNANFTRLDRTTVVDVRMGKYAGRGVGTYWLEHQAPGTQVAVVRKPVSDAGQAKLRLFTWGVDKTPLELEFFLFDERGNLQRHGLTSPDGFGHLPRSKAPELTDLPPGRYRLVLRREGTELDFDHPDVHLQPSQTLTMSLGFSKLVFRRDGKPWFDLLHDFGPTSELVELSVEDLASGKAIYRGRMVDFAKDRESGLWLEEGAYRVRLDNQWAVGPAGETRSAALRNALESEVHVVGGNKLYFDTTADDFLVPDEVLSREYQLAHADESPFRRPTPQTKEELAAAASAEARRYKANMFARYRDQREDTDNLYPYLGAATADQRVNELVQERLPREDRRRAAEARRLDPLRRPFMNEKLNQTFPDALKVPQRAKVEAPSTAPRTPPETPSDVRTSPPRTALPSGDPDAPLPDGVGVGGGAPPAPAPAAPSADDPNTALPDAVGVGTAAPEPASVPEQPEPTTPDSRRIEELLREIRGDMARPRETLNGH